MALGWFIVWGDVESTSGVSVRLIRFTFSCFDVAGFPEF